MCIAKFGDDVEHRWLVIKKIQTVNLTPKPSALRLGFVPLTDCAPLVMAHELGLFRKYNLRVALHRELGWATIRDKMIYRELDAAHAVAAMPFATTLGLGSVRSECLTALVLNLHGNAITLSNDLWKRGVRDGASLREEIIRTRHDKTFTFGVVFPYSSHHFLMRRWLTATKIFPGRDVRIVVVPPPQMVANLKAGHLDGFCVGEPWNSVAVQSKVGWCVATSAELEPGHPEKVLMVRREFAEKREAEHLALVAALWEACEFCDAPENREEVITTLAKKQYVNVPMTALRQSLENQFDFGHGEIRTVPDFDIFYRNSANEPSAEKAGWVLQQLRESGLCTEMSALNFALARQVFRADIFEKAGQLRDTSRLTSAKNEIQASLVTL